MAKTNDTNGPDGPKRNRRRKGPIDFDKLTPQQQGSIKKIAQVGGQIAVSQKAVHEAILKAVMATFDETVADNEGEPVVTVIFSALCASATLANAKRIAQHPDCPEEVREEVARRIAADEAERAERAARKAAEEKGSPPPGEEDAA